jgi:membrane dipeptidase
MNPTPIFDGHNDTLLKLFKNSQTPGYSFFERSETGHLDLPRARAGGLKGGIFAIFCPPPHDDLTPANYADSLDPVYAEKLTDAVINSFHNLLEQGQGQIGLVRSYSDLEAYLSNDILAMLLHIEGAEAIHANLDNLESYYNKGVRSLGLVWSRPNVFGNGIIYRYGSSPDTGEGLTARGKELVKACNRLGILVDLAHINEKGFWDVASITQAPLVVTHTGINAVCPVSRNILDTQIDAVGQSGGLIGIMFEPSEIREDGESIADTPLEALVRHIDHVVERIGIDSVALGSDFDGAMIPTAIKDVSGLPNLLQALVDRGYSAEDVEKIAIKNWLRILKTTLKA